MRLPGVEAAGLSFPVALVLDPADGIARVLVSRHEIHGNPVPGAVVQEAADPFAVAGGRPAHPDSLVNVFNRAHALRVEPEVLLPASVPEHIRQVRLVPHLEVPAADLFFTVPFQQEADKGLQVIPPGFVIRRGHDVRPVEKAALQGPSLLLQRQLLRHEGKLHERLHPRFQHVVVGCCAGVEIILGEPVRAFDVHLHGQVAEGAHVVTEDPVEADPLDAQGIMDEFQLFRVVCPKRQQRVP